MTLGRRRVMSRMTRLVLAVATVLLILGRPEVGLSCGACYLLPDDVGAALSGPDATERQHPTPTSVAGAGTTGFAGVQYEIGRRLAEFLNLIRAGGVPDSILAGAALTFAYGVLHTAGPGHGKIIVASYVIGSRASLAHAVGMSLYIAVAHVAAAVVTVVVLDVAARQALGAPPGELRIVRIFSYTLIASIGLHMAWRSMNRWRTRRHPSEPCQTACGCTPSVSGRAHKLLSIAVGAMPCTGALLVLSYTMAAGRLVEGLLLTAAMSGGMAITLATVAVVSSIGRRAVTARVDRGSKFGGRLSPAIGVASGVAVAVSGLMLLAGTV